MRNRDTPQIKEIQIRDSEVLVMTDVTTVETTDLTDKAMTKIEALIEETPDPIVETEDKITDRTDNREHQTGTKTETEIETQETITDRETADVIISTEEMTNPETGIGARAAITTHSVMTDIEAKIGRDEITDPLAETDHLAETDATTMTETDLTPGRLADFSPLVGQTVETEILAHRIHGTRKIATPA
jgi:hypothetical protein